MALAAGLANIGVSIGIATAPDLAHGETELLRFADDALYRAKHGGRNRYCLYSPSLPPEPARRQAQLREALSGQRSSA
ncbi:Cyclic di-GMP phosphodiesterase Gmr [compost metagenome]